MGRNTKHVDWELTERQFRLGLKTNTQIAADNHISRSALIRRAKREGWTKDLSAEVKLQTRARVSAAIVQAATATLQERDTKNASAVELEAISNSLLLAEHEKGGTKGRELMLAIIDRVAEQVASAPMIAELAQMVGQLDPEMAAALTKVTALPVLVDCGKKAVEAFGKASDIERKARGMDDKGFAEESQTMEAALEAIKAINAA